MTDAPPSHDRIKVFICHASEGKPAVRELCRKLRDAGFAPWVDEQELFPGKIGTTESTSLFAPVTASWSACRAPLSPGRLPSEGDWPCSGGCGRAAKRRHVPNPGQTGTLRNPSAASSLACGDLSQEGGFDRLVRTLQERGLQIEGSNTAAEGQPVRRFVPPASKPRWRRAYWLVAAMIVVPVGVIGIRVWGRAPFRQ
jgi:hypothetical protein